MLGYERHLSLWKASRRLFQPLHRAYLDKGVDLLALHLTSHKRACVVVHGLRTLADISTLVH